MSTYNLLNEKLLDYDTIVASARSDAAAEGSTIDVSCTMLDANAAVVDAVSLANRHSRDGSTLHTDVNLTPGFAADPKAHDDTYAVTTRLGHVSSSVAALYYAVHAPSGLALEGWPPVRTATISVYRGQELALIPDHKLLPQLAEGLVDESGPHQGLILGAFFREADGRWLAHEIGAAICSSTPPISVELMHYVMQAHYQSVR